MKDIGDQRFALEETERNLCFLRIEQADDHAAHLGLGLFAADPLQAIEVQPVEQRAVNPLLELVIVVSRASLIATLPVRDAGCIVVRIAMVLSCSASCAEAAEQSGLVGVFGFRGRPPRSCAKSSSELASSAVVLRQSMARPG